MGGCCSAPGEELPAVSGEELEKIRNAGFLPVVATPTVDFHGNNQLTTLYVALYENGAEITLLFLDEDRPNQCEDCLYDTIRRPLFGRFSDVESIIVIGKDMVFPGTFSADQTWKTKVPSHNEATVPLDKFERHGDGSEIVIFVNTWNHLLGDSNTNPGEKMTYQHPQLAGSSSGGGGGGDGGTKTSFVVRKGSRAEVDTRFKGLITSVSTVMTEERLKKLGKRIF
mmetsp:Transcript_57662/g.140825  ORF Transcript_57662/g.140825 Transcript_57662/m.140825 type:complete len:226 (+) Transcript_57662:168-845(+)